MVASRRTATPFPSFFRRRAGRFTSPRATTSARRAARPAARGRAGRAGRPHVGAVLRRPRSRAGARAERSLIPRKGDDPSFEGLHVTPGAVASARGTTDAHLGRGADVTTDSNGSVRIEILAREDCPNRGMALVVVERVVDETGVPAEIEVVEVVSDEHAQEYRLLGSPTVLVDGRDVDPAADATSSSARDDRDLSHRSRPVRAGLSARVDPRRAATRGRSDDLERQALARPRDPRRRVRRARRRPTRRSASTPCGERLRA